MKKILFIIDTVDNGGVGIVLKNLLTYLDKSKYEVSILTFDCNFKYEHLLPSEIAIFHAYEKNPAKSRSKIVRYTYGILRNIIPSSIIRALFIKEKYDIAIDFKGNNLNILCSMQCPKVLWSHKDYSPLTNLIEREMIETYGKTIRGKYKENRFRKQIRNVDHIVCISNYTKQGFVDRWHPIVPVSVVHNIIDTERVIRQSKEEVSYHKPSDRIVFCCVSRISKGKGIERLFSCVERLNAEEYIFDLNIVGGGDAFEEMQLLLKNMNLPNVKMLGNKDNPFPYLREADVFVCPSETECYSTVLCESIVLGKPIIMTNVGASKEIMDEGNYGFLVDNTELGILEGMRSFIEHPQYISQFSRSVETINSQFDIQKRIRELESFLDNIV